MIILVVLLGIVIFVGLYYINSLNTNSGYIFEPAKRTSITEVVSDSGKITSGGTIDVMSPTNGYISELFVDNGQKIKVGDKLFTVISSATDQERQVAYSNYLSALSALKSAQSYAHSLRSAMFTDWKTFYDLATNDKYEKSKGVPDENNRTSSEFNSTKENWLAAEQKVIDQDTAIAAYQAAVTSGLTAYQATQTTTVKAQVPGVVENISISINNTVSAPSVLSPTHNPVLTIMTNNIPEAMLAVGQTNITKVKVGQKVIIRPDSYRNINFNGTVLRVDKLGQNKAGVVTYNVYLQVNDPDNLLRSEMTIDGDIVTNEKDNVLTVPNSAIILYKGGKTVRVTKGHIMEYLPVKIGLKGESMTEIVEGIKEGQQVITALTNEKSQRPSLLGL